MNSSAPHYLPSPEEIMALCLEIQAEWSDQERERRSRGIIPSGSNELRRPGRRLEGGAP